MKTDYIDSPNIYPTEAKLKLGLLSGYPLNGHFQEL